jgi:glycine/D-amino acid oxidase-like deaminating enzyme
VLANFYTNTGHRSYGVTEAPATAEYLSATLMRETPVLSQTPLVWHKCRRANHVFPTIPSSVQTPQSTNHRG